MREILDGLPVEKLFGVGPKTLPAVHAAGIRTFGDLREASDEVLWRALRQARQVHARPRGRDSTIGPSSRIAKRNRSVRRRPSPTDIRGAARAHGAIAAARRPGGRAACARTNSPPARVSVKIRRADFTTYTRQRTFGRPTQDSGVVAAAAKSLLEQWLATQPNAAVRLLGVGVSDLQMATQGGSVRRRSGARVAPGLRHRRHPRIGSDRTC